MLLSKEIAFYMFFFFSLMHSVWKLSLKAIEGISSVCYFFFFKEFFLVFLFMGILDKNGR